MTAAMIAQRHIVIFAGKDLRAHEPDFTAACVVGRERRAIVVEFDALRVGDFKTVERRRAAQVAVQFIEIVGASAFAVEIKTIAAARANIVGDNVCVRAHQ